MSKYIYHEIQIHNKLGMNHFKNSATLVSFTMTHLTCFAICSSYPTVLCFPFTFPAYTEAKLSPELYFLIWQYLENEAAPARPDKYTDSIFVYVNPRDRYLWLTGVSVQEKRLPSSGCW